MTTKSFTHAISLLNRPVLWIPGLYAGILTATFIWLALSGEKFIAGKLLFLGVAAFPFFVGGSLGCMRDGKFTAASFGRSAVRYFFPVLLPVIVTLSIIILLLILFSIPFAIAGLGNDPALIGGLLIGITVPVLIFAFFADNVAVSEDLKVFASLKRSMMIASRSITEIISCIIICLLSAGALGVIMATIWGLFLADRFTQYVDLGVAEQQKIFAEFTAADWQRILGQEGILVSALFMAVYVMILISFFIIYKQQCYLSASSAPESALPATSGEYDEKGRWYKY